MAAACTTLGVAAEAAGATLVAPAGLPAPPAVARVAPHVGAGAAAASHPQAALAAAGAAVQPVAGEVAAVEPEAADMARRHRTACPVPAGAPAAVLPRVLRARLLRAAAAGLRLYAGAGRRVGGGTAAFDPRGREDQQEDGETERPHRKSSGGREGAGWVLSFEGFCGPFYRRVEESSSCSSRGLLRPWVGD